MLTVNKIDNYLQLKSDLVEEIISSPDSFLSVTLESQVNCCETEYSTSVSLESLEYCCEWYFEKFLINSYCMYLELFDVNTKKNIQIASNYNTNITSQISADALAADLNSELSIAGIHGNIEIYYFEGVLSVYFTIEDNYTPLNMKFTTANGIQTVINFECLDQNTLLNCDAFNFTIDTAEESHLIFNKIRIVKENKDYIEIKNNTGISINLSNELNLNTLRSIVQAQGYTFSYTLDGTLLTITIGDTGDDVVTCMYLTEEGANQVGRLDYVRHGSTCSFSSMPSILNNNEGVIYNTDAINIFSDFYNESILKDGIYSFKLTAVRANTDIEIEYICYFIDDNIKCDVVDRLAQDCSSQVALYYYMIKKAMECADCYCEQSCKILGHLYNELYNNSVNDNCVQSVCGC